MNLRALKTSHWIIVGLIAGTLVGVTRIMSAAEDPIGGRGYIKQVQFEEAIHAPPIDGHPYVSDIVIHPCPASDQIDLVSLKAYDAEANLYRDYLFAAPRNFTPSGTKSASGTTVANYLRALADANPAMMPRYAWWDSEAVTTAIYALLGALIIGGAWPPLLRLTGGPKPVEAAYDLDRFKHEAANEKRGLAAADEAHLHELDDELEASLRTGASTGSAASNIVASQPIRKLESHSVEKPPEAGQQGKDFAGEYYPVEKHSPHGFSLVELIVVIGIVTLLIAFALPALRYARMSAQTVKCAAQLHQLGIALHAYANSNKGSLPAWSGWHTWPEDAQADDLGSAWTVEMIPYIGNPDSPVYNCPSFPKPGRYRNYFLESQWSGRSGHSSMKLSDITMTGRFVLSGDTSNLGHFPDDVKGDDSDPDDFGGGMLLWPSDGGIFMHLGGNNVLFDDGHVSLCSHYNRDEMTFNPHRMQDHDEVTPD